MMSLLLLVDNRIIIQLKTTLCLVVQEQCMRMSRPERYIQSENRSGGIELIVPVTSRTMQKNLYIFKISQCSTPWWTFIYVLVGWGWDVPTAAGRAPHFSATGVFSGVEWLQNTKDPVKSHENTGHETL
jgi:hypothetical protein